MQTSDSDSVPLNSQAELAMADDSEYEYEYEYSEVETDVRSSMLVSFAQGYLPYLLTFDDTIGFLP